MQVTEDMIERFLAWPLPESVRADLCTTKPGYKHRTGTNLLTADEAKQMLTYVLADQSEEIARLRAKIDELLRRKDHIERAYRGYGTPDEERAKAQARLKEIQS